MKYEVSALKEIKFIIEAEDVCSAMSIVQEKGCAIRSMREVKENLSTGIMNEFKVKERLLEYLRESRRLLLKVFGGNGLSTYHLAQARMIEMQILYLIKEIKNA